MSAFFSYRLRYSPNPKKERIMFDRIKWLYKRLHFYGIKLPFVFLMIPIGFLFEFLVTFPFIVMVSIDSRRNHRR